MRFQNSLFVVATAIGLAATSASAQAQPPAGQIPQAPPGPARPPAFSPYLNLVRQGASPAVNYFGLVRPQNQFASSIQSLQNQASQINPYAAQAGAEQGLVTGNAFGFQNHRNYFQNQFTAGGLGAGLNSGGNLRPGGTNFGPPAGGPEVGKNPPRRK